MSLPKFIAVGELTSGSDAYITTSSNGKTWTEQTNTATTDMRGVCFGDGKFVAVGNKDGTGGVVLVSSDSVTWDKYNSPGNIDLRAVVYGNGLFVAVGLEGSTFARIVTSPDGITWTSRTNPKNNFLEGVTYGNGLFVAVGEKDGVDGYIITSPDGTTWTERANPTNHTIHCVKWIEELSLFVAGGEWTNTKAYLITSPDGITWTARVNPKDGDLYGIAYGDGLLVMVGNKDAGEGGSYIITSCDAVTWTEQTPATASGFRSIAFSSGLFVAVGDPTGADADICTSSGGISWQEQANTQNEKLRSITSGLELAYSTDNSISSDYIQNSVCFIDPEKLELHLLYSAQDSDVLNREAVYDLIKQKIYFIERTCVNRLQYGLLVSSTTGIPYNYGFIDSGYIERLENGTSFDGDNIVHKIMTGDAPIADSLVHQTQIRALKTIGVAKEMTTNSIKGIHYGDGNERFDETFTISPSNAGYRFFKNASKGEWADAVFHSFYMSMVTDDETIGFEPLYLAAFYRIVREDLI